MISEGFKVGWRKANAFIMRLHELGIVGDLDAKLPRRVLPKSAEDLSPEVAQFVERAGYSLDKVAEDIQRKGM